MRKKILISLFLLCLVLCKPNFCTLGCSESSRGCDVAKGGCIGDGILPPLATSQPRGFDAAESCKNLVYRAQAAPLPKVEHWKEKLVPLKDPIFQTGTLIPAPKGTGATYFLLDQTQTPKFVIKPIDERAHNTRCAQAEALSYAVASLLNLGHLTPETHLGIITHDNQEKLCSIQNYLSDLKNLCDLAESWLSQNTSDDKLAKLIDERDFEDLFLLILLFYDTDAHANNIYARKDQSGIYHLIKFDNGLTFPDKNRGLFNALYLLPNAKRKFSDRVLERIQTLPMEKLTEQFIRFEMEDALEAFQQRVEILRKIAKDSSMREIDIQFRKILITSSSVT